MRFVSDASLPLSLSLSLSLSAPSQVDTEALPKDLRLSSGMSGSDSIGCTCAAKAPLEDLHLPWLPQEMLHKTLRWHHIYASSLRFFSAVHPITSSPAISEATTLGEQPRTGPYCDSPLILQSPKTALSADCGSPTRRSSAAARPWPANSWLHGMNVYTFMKLAAGLLAWPRYPTFNHHAWLVFCWNLSTFHSKARRSLLAQNDYHFQPSSKA